MRFSGKETHERQSVCILVLCNVLWKVSARHPIRNKFEGVDCCAKEGDDIWMGQVFRHRSYLVECL